MLKNDEIEKGCKGVDIGEDKDYSTRICKSQIKPEISLEFGDKTLANQLITLSRVGDESLGLMHYLLPLKK